METKSGLNNVQRKMLDESYTEQFQKRAQPILNARKEGLERLRLQVIKAEMKKQPMRGVIAKLRGAYKAATGASEYMKKNGLSFTNAVRDNGMELDRYSGLTHPTIAKYQEETSKIEVQLANRKKEIRARIYGMNTTYEEVEREITQELASISVA